MAEETKPKSPAKSNPPAKKAKPSAIEDKPFTEFMQEHFLPSLETALKEKGLNEVQLEFTQDKLSLPSDGQVYWQVKGNLFNRQRQFIIYFLEENIKGPKAFSYATNGAPPSTIESFMIDERRVNLELMLLYTLQRLNGQKWLSGN